MNSRFTTFEQTPLKVAKPAAETTFITTGWTLPKEVVGAGEDSNLWKLITQDLCAYEEQFAQACMNMGYPASCINMSVKEIRTSLLNDASFVAVMNNIDIVTCERMIL